MMQNARQIICVLTALTLLPVFAASAEKKPPTDIEAERIASDLAMNDSLLQIGDIISPIAASLFSAG